MSASIAWIIWKLADRLAELLALRRVAGGGLEGALGDPDGLGGDPGARSLERPHRQAEPLPLRTDPVAGRDANASNASSAVGEPRIPILCSTPTDAEPLRAPTSTTKQDRFRCALAPPDR